MIGDWKLWLWEGGFLIMVVMIGGLVELCVLLLLFDNLCLFFCLWKEVRWDLLMVIFFINVCNLLLYFFWKGDFIELWWNILILNLFFFVLFLFISFWLSFLRFVINFMLLIFLFLWFLILFILVCICNGNCMFLKRFVLINFEVNILNFFVIVRFVLISRINVNDYVMNNMNVLIVLFVNFDFFFCIDFIFDEVLEWI